MKNKKAIFFGSWIGILVILTAVVNYLGNMPPSTKKPVSLPHPPIETLEKEWPSVIAHAVGTPKGSPNAPYTLVEFGDFCCPQCGLMHNEIAGLPSSAPVNLYFVNRPFPNLKGHEHAITAAEAADAAASQGKFWPMFEELYSHQKQLDPSNYAKYFDAIGLDGGSLSKDVASGKYLPQVKDSFAYCDSIKMEATPALILRDNKTARLQVAMGRDEINKLLAHAPWIASPAGPAPAVAKE